MQRKIERIRTLIIEAQTDLRNFHGDIHQAVAQSYKIRLADSTLAMALVELQSLEETARFLKP